MHVAEHPTAHEIERHRRRGQSFGRYHGLESWTRRGEEFSVGQEIRVGAPERRQPTHEFPCLLVAATE